MPKMIVKGHIEALPKRWLTHLNQYLEHPAFTALSAHIKFGLFIWDQSCPPQPEDLKEDTVQREWILLLKHDASSWPEFLPRVVAVFREPWRLGRIKKTLDERLDFHRDVYSNGMNSHLIREQERLLHFFKQQLVLKTEQRREALERSQRKLRRAQERLIRLNAMIYALSQASSQEELNNILSEQIPQLLSSNQPLTAEEESILDQIREITALVFHHRSQMAHSQELSEEWAYTFNSIDDPIAMISETFEPIRFNESFKKHDLQHHITDEIRELATKAMTSQQSTSADIHLSQTDRWYYVRCMPLITKHRHMSSFAVLYYRDLTTSRSIRTHILQAEKLAELGVLAGSVAHEINNPLAGILAFIQLTRSSLGADHAASEDLKQMEKAALQCKTIVANLLSFSRRTSLEESGLISIHQILETAAPLIQLQLKHEHAQSHFQWDKQMKTFFVYGSFNHFLQILLNLSTLSLESMRSEGKSSDFMWKAYELNDKDFAIELLTTHVSMQSEPREPREMDRALLNMCHYVTVELLRQNNARLEEIKNPDTHGNAGWRVIIPAAPAHKRKHHASPPPPS